MTADAAALTWTDALTGDVRTMTREALDRELSPSRFVDSLDAELAVYASRSAAARDAAAQRGRLREGLRYGESPGASLDLLSPSSSGPAPLLIYVHGGFWQQLSRRESAFAGAGIVARGGALAAVGYTLAPEASLTQIVAEVRQAIRFLRRQAGELGLDRDRFVIAGSSAGAHLAAMALAEDDEALPQDALHGACLVSGVYDLRAVRHSYVNDVAGIRDDEEEPLSPARRPRAVRCPVLLAVGEHEPDEFKREMALYGRTLARAGALIRPVQIAGRHHFDVILDLDRRGTFLGHATLAMLGLLQGED
ncbi:MAG: alpha/beta hydrolase [Pseudomonadota bacterium]